MVYFIILRLFLSVYTNCQYTTFLRSKLQLLQVSVSQVIQNMSQYLCILPTRRCSATRLKHSISAGVILHLSLAIIFEVSMREVEDQKCQHSATLYLQQLCCDQDHHHQGVFLTYNRTGGCLPFYKKWV